MKLEGSCHCGAVKFSVETNTPQPYQRCYCSVCRKTAGGGGYAINLMAWSKTLEVTGEKNAGTYHAIIDGEKSEAERRFCKRCGSPLWLYDPRWPDLIHPIASAIDTPLPKPKAHTHVLLEFKGVLGRGTAGSRPRALRSLSRNVDRGLAQENRDMGGMSERAGRHCD